MDLKELSKKRFYSVDFSKQDLRGARMRQSLFHNCNFDEADLTEADCSGSDFQGSSFDQTNCYRTNFKDAVLAGTKFNPRDCFGMTLTLQCRTFQGTRVGALWFYAWLLFATMMHPYGGETDMVDRVKIAIGPERWAKLRAMFGKREF